MKKKFILFLVIFLSLNTFVSSQTIELNGLWDVSLDYERGGQKEVNFDKKMYLPGTTDGAGLGTPNVLVPKLEKPQLSHLTRSNSFVGEAWYSKEVLIPNDWKDKYIELKLERVLWTSIVYIDGELVDGACNSLSAPHVYNLSKYLTPGKHRLTICVDNRKLYDDLSDADLAHAYTNHTQIIWNGILGEISLTAKNLLHISHVDIIPSVDSKSFIARTTINNLLGKDVKASVSYTTSYNSNKVNSKVAKITVPAGETIVEQDITMDEVKFWSEFSPDIYEFAVAVKSSKHNSVYKTDFGMRNFSKKGNMLINNNIPIFLRGTLECCIFPLTGHPPMAKNEWLSILNKARLWGLNHLRFHSWCPPKAAFEAADELGFYLQVELPLWSLKVGKDTEMTKFLYAEADRIIREYGNHPSFCMFSLGNELQGDMAVLADLVSYLKQKDTRRLYTTTSFTFEKGFGRWPEKEDDFFITQWTKKGWVRGQGVFNSESPTFNKDYYSAVDSMQVPLITHEIGQYAVYPNLKEIKKYTGVLEPLNFMAIRNDLQQKGLIDYADDYLQASGKLAALLYKEEIERAMKTSGISGFQLLDLHDFSGQGTALVGLLDAFWDSKGVMSGKEFTQFCAPVVPLLRFPKAVYTNNESFVATIEMSNYFNKVLNNKKLVWNVIDENSRIIKTGSNIINTINIGHNAGLGNIEFSLKEIDKATRLTINLYVDGTSYQNTWDIWVYPFDLNVDFGKVKYTRSYNEAKLLLSEGETVLYNPDWKSLVGIEGKFVPVFWSPVHFPKQAGTMGVLCEPTHQALNNFPTDSHTNWQWWDLNINSTTLIVDSIKGGSSIVSMIDNFTNNRRLSSIYEGRVASGKLIISSIDLATDIENRVVAKQLLHSLLKYMNSGYFNPKPIDNFDYFNNFIRKDEKGEKESATSIY